MPTPSVPPARPPRDFARLAFIASTFALVFGYGLAVGAYNVFPYRYILAGVNAIRELRENWRTDTGVRPELFLEPARYAGSGVTRHEDARMQAGLTLVAAFIDGGNELRLIRADGTAVRRWPVKFGTLFPRTDHVQPASVVPKSEWHAELHDALVQPDGAVVFNFEAIGLVKLDRCGQVLWTLPRMVHHAISPTADGGFWVASKRYVTGASPYPHLRTPFYDETVMKVAPDGTVQQEISVLEALLRSAPGAFYGNATYDIPNADMIHVNDVEPLDAAHAPAFPRFAEGDLLVSLRGLSLLSVLRPSTGRVVWTQIGSWLRQHDPDFQTNGHITIFSNNTYENGAMPGATTAVPDPMGATTIVDLDPASGESRVLYGGTPNQPLYSAFRGKHQMLANGNLLIVESNAGRVIEVTPSGDVVWEYVNRFDERDAAVVYQAQRYADSYFTVSDWTCAATAPR